MALDKSRLREQIVFIEMVDAARARVDARGYMAAARAVRRTIEQELAGAPMRAFVSDVLPALETTAQNIFFEDHGRFADIDGSGRSWVAQAHCQRLLRRLRRPRR